MCTLHFMISILSPSSITASHIMEGSVKSGVELTYPVSLEAILTAEKRRFAQFLAVWTL